MITKIASFKASDESLHPTIQAAQIHELSVWLEFGKIAHSDQAHGLASLLVESKEQIMNILTMKASSHPRARKMNRKAKGPDKATGEKAASQEPITTIVAKQVAS